MKIGIMQPYFFPYIGYFQLMNAVDEFVIYDHIQYTKKGWINRNKILVNESGYYISLPLKKDSDFLPIKKRCLSDLWQLDKKKLISRLKESYRKAPYFNDIFFLIESCMDFRDKNLFNFILNSLTIIKEYLGISTPFVISSTIPINQNCKGEKMVIEICKARKANIYINPIGGINLYNKTHFISQHIDLHLLVSKEVKYKQYNNQFIPFLSIIDVMMFNSREKIQQMLDYYELI